MASNTKSYSFNSQFTGSDTRLGCQLGDCRWPLLVFLGDFVGMYGLTYSLTPPPPTPPPEDYTVNGKFVYSFYVIIMMMMMTMTTTDVE